MNMVENYAWGISWTWGNNKHPPLFSWVTAIWFKVFPTSDWAYYLLNEISLLVALVFLMLSMRKILSENKAYIALALTIVIFPIGITTGYKYNANLAQWPFITGYLWALLSAFSDRQKSRYLLAGVFAGAALLCKYSAILLIGPVSLTLWLYFRPRLSEVYTELLLMVLVCFTLLAPHIYWEMQHNWPSLLYMHERHHPPMNKSWLSVVLAMLLDVLRFVAGSLAIVIIAMITRRNIPDASRSIYRPQIRPGLLIFVLSIGAIFVASSIEHMKPVSDWFIVPTIFFGWAVVDVLPDYIEWNSFKSRINWLIILYFISATLLAIHDRYMNDNSRASVIAIPKTLSKDVTDLYHSIYSKPIDYAAGTFPLAYDLSFYSEDHPYAMYGLDTQQSNWIDINQFKLKSKVIICSGINSEKHYTPTGPACSEQAVRQFGLPDTQRTLKYMAYDPAQKMDVPVEFNILMYR